MRSDDESYSRAWWSYPRGDERHTVASLFHLMSLILMVTSLVHLSWFHVKGCRPPSLGPKYFVTMGHFDAELTLLPEVVQPPSLDVSIKYHSDNAVLECISPDVLCLMRLLAFLSVLSIISSMVGFCLDIIGPTKRPLRFLRRNAIPSIFSVLCIISIIGVSYFVTSSLEMAAREQHRDRLIQVSYDYGFYAISAAGGLSLLATACNILQEPAVYSVRGRVPPGWGGRRPCRLMEDDPFEAFTVCGISHPPPPPPYSP